MVTNARPLFAVRDRCTECTEANEDPQDGPQRTATHCSASVANVKVQGNETLGSRCKKAWFARTVCGSFLLLLFVSSFGLWAFARCDDQRALPLADILSADTFPSLRATKGSAANPLARLCDALKSLK